MGCLMRVSRIGIERARGSRVGAEEGIALVDPFIISSRNPEKEIKLCQQPREPEPEKALPREMTGPGLLGTCSWVIRRRMGRP